MRAIRRRLMGIASAWLACQLSLLAVTPVSLSVHAPDAADAVTCTCVHTGNAQCPMHHPAKPKPGCECRNSTDPGAANIVSLLGPIAVLASAPARIAAPSITKLPAYPTDRFTGFVTAPDGPPPRA